MNLKALFFSAQGRLNRLSFFLAQTLLIVILAVLSMIAGLVGENIVILVIAGVVNLVGMIAVIFLAIKRFHDFGKSGLFLLGYLIVAGIVGGIVSSVIIFAAGLGENEDAITIISVIFALIFALYVYLKPGTKGENKYGNEPERLFDVGIKKD